VLKILFSPLRFSKEGQNGGFLAPNRVLFEENFAKRSYFSDRLKYRRGRNCCPAVAACHDASEYPLVSGAARPLAAQGGGQICRPFILDF